MGRRGRYSDEFKREAVTMVTPDRPVQEVAIRLGVAPGTLWTWVEQQRLNAAHPGSAQGGDQVEKAVHDAALARIRQLEAENDFLGKASAYFAGKVSRKT